MRKILLIDRDGTLIQEPEDFQVDRLDKVKLVEGVIPALNALQAAGYELVMITNQDGLGTKSFPEDDFWPAHSFMLDLFRSQGIRFNDVLICPHLPSDDCLCRKPRLGLLTDYLRANDINWEQSAVIGDRISDMELAESLKLAAYQLTTGDGPWTWASLSADLLAKPRQAEVCRRTKETKIQVRVNLDGKGQTNIDTGLKFFDHMLEQLGKHSGMDLNISCQGDLEIDDHHTIEDTGLALGQAMKQALADKCNIGRYGFSLPMDECRADAVLDLSDRPVTMIDLPFTTARLGDISTEMLPHFFESFANTLGANLHVRAQGQNNHHLAEAAFKATARALGQAISRTGQGGLPSTKGQL